MMKGRRGRERAMVQNDLHHRLRISGHMGKSHRLLRAFTLELAGDVVHGDVQTHGWLFAAFLAQLVE